MGHGTLGPVPVVYVSEARCTAPLLHSCSEGKEEPC